MVFLGHLQTRRNEKDVLSDLGREYRIGETYIKIHGGCRGNHAPIDVIQNLIRGYGILPSEIKEIKVKVDSVTMAADILNPQNVKQAQFSIPFSIAVAILEGNASIYQFTDQNVKDPKVRSLMSRIFVEVDKNLDKEFPNKRGAYGEIILAGGKRLSSSIDIARGEPEAPLSFEEIEEKFVLPHSRHHRAKDRRNPRSSEASGET